MEDWVRKAQPPIVIIENVLGAPWEKKEQRFNELGYYAAHMKLDTKQFYIPHTRQRGYLFAVRKPEGKKKTLSSSSETKKWSQIVKDLQRQIREKLSRTNARLGISWKDLEGVYGGEVCAALLQPWDAQAARTILDAAVAEAARDEAAQGAPALVPGHPFADVRLAFYWTSTSATEAPQNAWGVGLASGGSDNGPKTGRFYAWPVRGGQ